MIHEPLIFSLHFSSCRIQVEKFGPTMFIYGLVHDQLMIEIDI